MDIKLHKQHQNLQKSHFWFKVKDNLLKDLVQRYLKSKDKILDFGCNYGHSTRLLQSLGYDTFGLDISDEAIGYGRSLGIKNIFLESEKYFPPNSFDAIISLDVLEHIEDDKNALKNLLNLVRPNGIIVIMVPAYMFLWGVQDTISHHYRRYTLKKLIDLSNSVGAEVIRKSYFNTLLFIPIAMFRLFTRFFIKNPHDSDLDINNSFMNKLFFYIFDFERRILRYFDMPFGVSILLILRKK